MLLGIDRITEQIRAINKDIHVGGLVDGGFFHDIEGSIISHGNDLVDEYDEDTQSVNYPKKMRELFHFMNISSGAPGSCIRGQITIESDCIFAKNLIPKIKAPLLLFQVLGHVYLPDFYNGFVLNSIE